MGRTIAVRGKKEIVAIFIKYSRLSGNQDQGRPQSAADFVRYVAGLPMNEETKAKLKAASKLPVDVSDIDDCSVPLSIKIIVDVSDEEWDKAMGVFKFVFDLKNIHMPYFLKVAGKACIESLEEQNAELGIIEEKGVEAFSRLSTDEKLIEIYKLLVERRG